MPKNNNIKNNNQNKKNIKILGYIFFGYIIGVWNSLYIVVQYNIDLLWFISGGCVALCFLGFLYYWIKHHKIDEIDLEPGRVV